MVTNFVAVAVGYPDNVQVAVIVYVPTAQYTPQGERIIEFVSGAAPGTTLVVADEPFALEDSLQLAPPSALMITVKPVPAGAL